MRKIQEVSNVMSITKADINSPGEINGTILNQKTIGTVQKNSDFGIYGSLDNLSVFNIDTNNAISVAGRDEIQIGNAKILTSLDGVTTKEYDIKIEKIYTNNNYDNKSMLIRVVDKELLDATGGIIRGLSGSPLIQNNKFVRSSNKCSCIKTRNRVCNIWRFNDKRNEEIE